MGHTYHSVGPSPGLLSEPENENNTANYHTPIHLAHASKFLEQQIDGATHPAVLDSPRHTPLQFRHASAALSLVHCLIRNRYPDLTKPQMLSQSDDIALRKALAWKIANVNPQLGW